MGLVNDVFTERAARGAHGRPGHGPRALLHRGRHRGHERPALPDRVPPRAHRGGPQRQPRERDDPAPRAGGGGLDLPVHLRHRGDPPPLRAQPPRAAGGRDRGQPDQGHGRLLRPLPDPGRARGRARSLGLPAAGDRTAPRRAHRLLGDVRARPHRRQVRARRGAGRAGDRGADGHPLLPPLPAGAAQPVHLRARLLRAAGQPGLRQERAGVAPRPRAAARAGSARRRGHGRARARQRHGRGARLRAGERPALPVGPHPEPLRGTDVHRARASPSALSG